MRTRMKVLAVVAAACCICTMALAANASAITLRPGGNITATGRLAATDGIITVTCNVTLVGRFLTSIPSARGSVAGAFTSGTAAGCSPAGTTVNFTINALAPAQILVNTPLGAPNLTGVLFDVTNYGYTATIAGVTCSYLGTLGVLAPVIALENTPAIIRTITLETLLPKIMGACTRPTTRINAGQLIDIVPLQVIGP